MSSRDGDDFDLFGLPRRFDLDVAELDARRRALQGQVHPDRFASSDAASRRIAMQWAVRVNEAHARLKNPLRRAAYLCELGGVPIAAEDNTAMPADFLMQQMQWREALDEAREPASVQSLASELAAQRADAHRRLARSLDDSADFAAAAQEVRSLMFVERLIDDIEDRLAALEA
ncbi:MAG: Fe-S protein assembly co-chaperone HscB [Caldimonas sp.]